jgi:hypothetical protein
MENSPRFIERWCFRSSLFIIGQHKLELLNVFPRYNNISLRGFEIEHHQSLSAGRRAGQRSQEYER